MLIDGVKFGLGFAIGWWLWNDVIRFNMEQLAIAYYCSDFWKEAYKDMPEALKRHCKPWMQPDAWTK